MGRWNDIKQRLPKFDKCGGSPCYRILVCLNSTTVTEAYYWGNGDFYINGVKLKNVTDWMYLPKPPKKEKQNGC